MIKIAVLTIKLYAPWVHSLKEKRMVVKSLMSKIRNKFQISVAEVQDQDIHQSIVIGIVSTMCCGWPWCCLCLDVNSAFPRGVVCNKE